ncbi:MAG: D-alanyl-D-alanine carboxypeptidase [Nitrospirae bacterium]|nr:D-alanyl-D-alanine carboxypeptidase [Nitrospirota bacterium]
MKKHSLLLFISAFLIVAFLCTIPIPSTYAAKKNTTTIKKKQTTRKAKTKALKSGLQKISKNPYLGAIAIDAATSKVLFEDNPDVKGYPASMVKMMNLLVILEAIEAKHITLQDKVTISAEVAKVGGSQVYLKEREVHTVDDLIYALMIPSANDAALALALHYTGNKDKFIAIMNKRAQELGMTDTTFTTVNGLPPDKGKPDVSTPRDITKLCLELLNHPEALRYTSTKERLFRTDSPKPLVMRNHNHLVGSFEGCDGFKTGYFRAAGFSIAATVSKNGERVIAVIFGSADRNVRDASARKILSKSFMELTAGLPSSASDTQEITASIIE